MFKFAHWNIVLCICLNNVLQIESVHILIVVSRAIISSGKREKGIPIIRKSDKIMLHSCTVVLILGFVLFVCNLHHE